MFFTSFTTMMAFLSGGLSPILPLGSFGIFTGILIAVNYVSVIVFFPTVIHMHHVYFSTESQRVDIQSDIQGSNDIVKEKSNIQNGDIHTQMINLPPLGTEIKTNSPIGKEIGNCSEKKAIDPVTGFLRGKYFRFVSHVRVRWIIIGGFLTLIGFLAWSATNIQVDAEEVSHLCLT
jgi:predicted RND superfamily exporter protein